MATLKVKLRVSKVKNKPGTIYYLIIHKREIKQISTNIKIKSSEWDSVNSKVKNSDKESVDIQEKIDSDVRLLNRIIKDFDLNRSEYNVGDIIYKFNNVDKSLYLLSYMQSLICEMIKMQKLGTAHNYHNTYLSFSMFLEGKDILLYDVTESLVEKYNVFLVKRGLVKNSISFYMRILRSVYNKAANFNNLERYNPFKNVYTGVYKTRKRAVDESVIAKLLNLDVSRSKSLSFAKDLFLFSYYTRGMSFVDIAFLKRKDIVDGTICYSRRKTGQLMSVKVETCIMDIILKYIDPSSSYVFPIISSLNLDKAYHEYTLGINRYNRQLKKLSDILNLGVKLTSYVARHSWATSARNHNIPMSVISAGLGHSSEHTTEIYLATLDNSIVDEANKIIISAIK